MSAVCHRADRVYSARGHCVVPSKREGGTPCDGGVAAYIQIFMVVVVGACGFVVGLDFGKGRIAIQEVENDEVLVGKGRIAIQEVENDKVFSSVSLSFTHARTDSHTRIRARIPPTLSQHRTTLLQVEPSCCSRELPPLVSILEPPSCCFSSPR